MTLVASHHQPPQPALYDGVEMRDCDNVTTAADAATYLAEQLDHLVKFIEAVTKTPLPRKVTSEIAPLVIAAESLRIELAQADEVGLVCPFDGPVDVEYYRDAAVWTCPVCKHEHEVAHEDER